MPTNIMVNESEDYVGPEPTNLTKQSVYAIARSVADSVEYEPNGDIRDAVKKLGGTIEYRDFWQLDSPYSGSLDVEGVRDFTIFFAMRTSLERDRFTVGHELGHYALHYLWRKLNSDDVPQRMRALRYGSSRIEWEANWFAAEFLMPESKFEIAIQEFGNHYASIARFFGVSVMAAKVRYKALQK